MRGNTPGSISSVTLCLAERTLLAELCSVSGPRIAAAKLTPRDILRVNPDLEF